jgi:predicted DNA repair protein MutK
MSGLLYCSMTWLRLPSLTAVHIDDVASQASRTGVKIAGSVIDDEAKAGTNSLGGVIDDAAVTPKFVQNLPVVRELLMVLKIARGLVFDKIVILLRSFNGGKVTSRHI